MREQILKVTVEAIRDVTGIRFFQTERGYQGRLYCALHTALDKNKPFDEHFILEMEYQKTPSFHNARQRPDIIFHAPVEHTHQNRHDNNIAVWALKRRASSGSATEDFTKLDMMVEHLQYSVIVFVNIDTDNACFGDYGGHYRDRLICFAVKKVDDRIVGYAQTEHSKIDI